MQKETEGLTIYIHRGIPKPAMAAVSGQKETGLAMLRRCNKQAPVENLAPNQEVRLAAYAQAMPFLRRESVFASSVPGWVWWL